MHAISRKLTSFFGSRLFFGLVIGFFVLQAFWFVFSAVYPMAFDEDFHFGVINLYAQGWSPFLAEHPEAANQFGAVTRDPSYLFHYLMSFPYRLLTHVTSDQSLQIATLRLMNVAMFAYGLVLFRKVMLRAGASVALAHVALAIFILLPIVPQLAAHINYDNLLMILLPLMCLTLFDSVDALRQRRIAFVPLASFVVICLYMSVVKYAVLPFIIAGVVFLLLRAIRAFWGYRQQVFAAARRGFVATPPVARIGLLALGAIGTVLFLQRYAVNAVLYHTPVPDCGQVLSVDQCSEYGPWGRDYGLAQQKSADFAPDPVFFMGEWLDGMWLRTFFAITGPHHQFTNYLPLPLPGKTAVVVLTLGLIAVLLYHRKIFRSNPYVTFLGAMSLFYCAVLIFDEFGMYTNTGKAVAINGRYLLLIWLFVAVLMGRGLALAFARLNAAWLKPFAAALVIVLMLHGGGVMTFILRSDRSWYWSTEPAWRMNEAAQKVLRPLIIEGEKVGK